jgi:hypothetical protein
VRDYWEDRRKGDWSHLEELFWDVIRVELKVLVNIYILKFIFKLLYKMYSKT